jgi:integrase
MPATNKLSAVRLRTVQPGQTVQKLSDGGGFFLQVEPSGSRLWRLSFRYAGKQRTISMGAFPAVGLADARAARDAAKALLAQGIDPSAARRAAKAKAVEEAAPPPVLPTWDDVAREYLRKLRAEGLSAATIAKATWPTERTSAAIGRRPIAEISAPEVLAFLRVDEAAGRHETAARLRSHAGRVFRYGIATERCDRDVAADLRGALITPPRHHHPAITDPKGVGGLMRAIRGYEGDPATKAGLLLLAYTFLRNGEVRHLEWGDVDSGKARITIPAQRMKMPRPHIVPLSRQASEALESMRPISGRGRLVLTSLRTAGRAMSENTLNAALRRMGYPKEVMVPHGFRTIASTGLNEMGFNRDWIERQLAHVEGNAVRAAYNAAEYLPGRTEMMQAWADHLDQLADARPE